MFCCMENINVKRLIMATLGVFVFILASDFVIHQLILGSTYHEFPSLWRSEEEMKSYMLYMLIGQFLIAKFFTLIFAKGYEGKGVGEGLRFGMLIGPFAVAPSFIQYAVYPLPSILLWSWVGLGLIQSILAGLVVGILYKK